MSSNLVNNNFYNIRKIFVKPDSKIKEILTKQNLSLREDSIAGLVLVVDSDEKLLGVITDGDLRRAILKFQNNDFNAKDIMTKNPIIFSDYLSYQEILQKIPYELKKRNRKSKKFLEKIIIVNKNRQPIRVVDYFNIWEQKVASHRRICVVGLGYVGITLSLSLASKGYHVTGIENDNKKLNNFYKKKLPIHEIGLREIFYNNYKKNFFVEKKLNKNKFDVYIIAVGTPIGNLKKVNLSYLKKSLIHVAKVLSHGDLVILRSTVPVGTTRDIAKVILEKFSRLQAGIDFHLAFAPERTLEGDALKELNNLPQIIGGINKDSLEAASAIFRDLNSNIIKVDTLESAELAKLLNNCFRNFIFSFSNEMSAFAQLYNLDINKVINAANEGYPRDKIPLPSPGVGGPCLTKDPYILDSSLKISNYKNKKINIFARNINDKSVDILYNRIIKEIDYKEFKKKPKIVICGLAFKGDPETDDFRNSTSYFLAKKIKNKYKKVYIYDAIIKKNNIKKEKFIYERFINKNKFDVIILANNHKSFKKWNINSIIKNKLNNNSIIIDCWSVFDYDSIITNKNITYLNLSLKKKIIPKKK
jgi:nucleotide sugar dehydrogenase